MSSFQRREFSVAVHRWKVSLAMVMRGRDESRSEVLVKETAFDSTSVILRFLFGNLWLKRRVRRGRRSGI